ncbi:fatty acid--CoA ligase family protein [Antrihabitans sp. YC3-6]|uniref:Fatty acid--CoA ligase family protein n=1 Tax=Antrihabitans stalagmiti TaxID=2799499 RepID=A0A934U4C4_9NOCA|nr:FadD3 family acyl-CoA ligase [Antrihabitans stalagmiti]MBJ8340306.1 fatty acid--CoA ligase family protein [Antrihabitans stalagmiti]
MTDDAVSGATEAPQTTPAALHHAARAFGDHDAIVDGTVRWTYSDLLQQVRTAARALIARGIDTGDRIAIWAPNTHHWIVAALAAQYAGAAVVPINTRYTGTEAHDIIHRSQARALFVAGRFLGKDRLADLRSVSGELAIETVIRIPVDDDETDATSGDLTWADLELFARAVSPNDADERALAVAPDDLADIMFTSGTTGRSKGAMSAHRQSLATSRAWAKCGQLSSADRYLVINPFFHNFGYKAGILACLQTGATLVPQLVFDVEAAMRNVDEQKITVLPGPPTIYQTILDHPARGTYDLSSLRFAVTGAAVIPVVMIERMQAELDIDIVLTAYGLSEASGFGTMCNADDDAVTVATTCGRPIADFELRIADSGEVLLRGPNVMLGYLDDPENTAKTIDSDGWLHTGDIGSLDERGNLRITDRLKDMYISGGFNVYPAEIEQALARIDGVAETAVIGIPDERLGEVGKAFVVTAPGRSVSADDVITFARTELANFKVPRVVEFVDALPRNAGGKVLKRQLREESS